jgi:hypothetical protein
MYRYGDVGRIVVSECGTGGSSGFTVRRGKMIHIRIELGGGSGVVLVTFDPINAERLAVFFEEMDEECHDVNVISLIPWQFWLPMNISNLFDCRSAVDKPAKLSRHFWS